jgi:hypothetical protein
MEGNGGGVVQETTNIPPFACKIYGQHRRTPVKIRYLNFLSHSGSLRIAMLA